MTRPSIDEIRGAGDLTTMFRWNLIVTKFPTGVAGVPTSNDLNVRCLSAELPKITDQTIIQPIRGHKVKQPGIHDYSDAITFTFVETVDNIVANFIKNWSEAAWQPKTGKSLPKNQLEALVTIQRLNSEDNPIFEYNLTGVLLQDYDLGTLDDSSSEAIKPTVTLSYDFFEQNQL